MTTCTDCKQRVEEWNEHCDKCGFHLVLEPDEAHRARFLRGPSLGALLFTQGWTFGSRLYIWFLASLIPGIGIAALILCLFFGRRWAWRQGGWESWNEFRSRMRLLDAIAIGWIILVIVTILWMRY